MGKYNIYDSHTLFVLHNGHTEEQIKQHFQDLLNKFGLNLKNLHTKFIVQIVYDKNNKVIGHCFVYVTNPKAFEALIKLKEQALTPITISQATVIDTNKPKESSDCHHSWSELIKSEPEYTVIEQVPNTIYYDRAFISPIDQNIYNNNTLKSTNVPFWISESILRKVFSQFSNNPNYPTVNILNFVNGRMAFVSFDPESNDANFALHMTKKMNLSDGDKQACLIWYHSYNNQNKDTSQINTDNHPTKLIKTKIPQILTKPKFTNYFSDLQD